MFTGIVQAVTEVKSIEKRDGVLRMRLGLPLRWKVKDGQSISIQGICTTVVGSGKGWFDVEYMPETIRKTTVGGWRMGTRVNLERSLSYGDPIDGQLLPGHVDARARVLSVKEDGASRLIAVSIPSALSRRVPLHGWIALDGVSLTVARKSGTTVTVALVPYTLSVTTLGILKKGDAVNLETDRSHQSKTSVNRGKVPAHASRTTRRHP